MPIDRKLLEILCCPVTKQPLRLLNPDELARINAKISDGQIVNAKNVAVATTLDEGLITENRQRIYRIDDSIPIMLEAESIPADQFEGLSAR